MALIGCRLRYALHRESSLAITIVAALGIGLTDVGRGQSFTEFPIPTVSSFPVGIAASPDGYLWFTEFNGNKIGRVTTAGVFTEFLVPTASSGPEGIAAGPDGNIWFTERTGNK